MALTDEEIIARHDISVKGRAKIELAIVHKVIQEFRSAGYIAVADDGESKYYGDEQGLVAAIFSVDEAHLYLIEHKDMKDSFVYFVMGNDGHDVICDYGVSLEPIMKPIFDWIESEQEKGNM